MYLLIIITIYCDQSQIIIVKIKYLIKTPISPFIRDQCFHEFVLLLRILKNGISISYRHSVLNICPRIDRIVKQTAVFKF